MSKTSRLAWRSIVMAALGLAMVGGTARANLLQNPGFETGSLSPWTASPGGFSVLVDPNSAHSGDCCAFLTVAGSSSMGASNSGTLSQTLTTVIGQTYELDFFAATVVLGMGDPTLTLTFGGVPVTAQPITIPTMGYGGNGYTEFSFQTVATSTSSTLTFTGLVSAPPLGTSSIYIDDTSVTPIAGVVPEPSSIVLCGLSGAMGLAWMRVRRRRRRNGS